MIWNLMRTKKVSGAELFLPIDSEMFPLNKKLPFGSFLLLAINRNFQKPSFADLDCNIAINGEIK